MDVHYTGAEALWTEIAQLASASFSCVSACLKTNSEQIATHSIRLLDFTTIF